MKMNLNENTFQQISVSTTTLKEHFEQMFQSVSLVVSKGLPELAHYLRFIESLISSTSQYEKSLLKIGEEFQSSVREFKTEELLSNSFKKVNTSLADFALQINKLNFTLTKNKFRIIEVTKSTKAMFHRSVNAFCGNANDFKNVLPKCESDYKKFVRMMIFCSNSNIMGIDGKETKKLNDSEKVQFSNAKKLEENVTKSFTEMKAVARKNFDFAKNQIQVLILQDVFWKTELMKSTDEISVQLLKGFGEKLKGKTENIKKTDCGESETKDWMASNKKSKSARNISVENELGNSNEKRGKYINSNREIIDVSIDSAIITDPLNFQNPFENLLHRFVFGPHSEIILYHKLLSFVPYVQFLRVNFALENLNVRNISNRLGKLASETPPRARLTIELLVSHFLVDRVEFTADLIQELASIMEQKRFREFFLYSLLFRKCIRLQTWPFSSMILKKKQMKNLQTISHYFFKNYFEFKTADFDLIFDFMKFLMCVHDKEKRSFMEHCSSFPIFADVLFWTSLFDYLVRNSQNSNSDTWKNGKPVSNNHLISSFKQIAGVFGLGNEQISGEENSRVFDELVVILFQLKVDFETITDVLIALALKARVGLDHVRHLLTRNQDLLITQVANITHVNSMEFCDKRFEKLHAPRSVKTYSILLKCTAYLGQPDEVLRLVFLNKYCNSRKLLIFKKALRSFNFSGCPAFRRFIYRQMISGEIRTEALSKSFDTQLASIITMDVHRTFSKHPKFDSGAIEKILNNISHPDIGNFSYYQGMNYLVTYFYTLFEGHELDTYNFVIWLVERDFAGYFDRELKNVRKLFFSLKKFFRRNLSTLSNYLEFDLQIDTDVIFAAWCLTLFTMVTQNQERTPFLDEIIDIFISQGWPGFFKTVLVILSELQEQLLQMSYDNILMMMSDLAKNNFKELMKENQVCFSLKERIGNFPKVTKIKMRLYEKEYEQREIKVNHICERIDGKINELSCSEFPAKL